MSNYWIPADYSTPGTNYPLPDGQGHMYTGINDEPYLVARRRDHPRRRGVDAMSAFACDTCFDTFTIDQCGAEVPCPDCQAVVVKLTGLSHGAGLWGVNYTTAVAYSSSTITFCASTRGTILADVRRVRDAQVRLAKSVGLTGRNSTSSWAIAIYDRVAKAVQS